MPTLTIRDDFTVYTAADYKERLLALVDSDEDVSIVLSEVTDIDTAGLQLLLLARREAEAVGRAVRLVEPSAAVTDVLALAHLDHDLNDLSTGRPVCPG